MRIPLTTLSRTRGSRGNSNNRGAEPNSTLSDRSSLGRLFWQKTLLVFCTIVLLSVLMSVHLMPDKVSLHLGDVAPRDITAPRSVIYVNSVATAEALQAARFATSPAYDVDERAPNNAVKIANEQFDHIERARTRFSSADSRRVVSERQLSAVHALQSEFGNGLSLNEINTLLSLSPAVYQRLKTTTLHLVTDAMERDIKDQTDVGTPSPDMRHARLDVLDSARDTLSSNLEVKVVEAVAARALQPNRLINRHRTDAAREAAAQHVRPIFGRIVRGDAVISQGERVTQEHLDKFQGLGMLDPRLEIQTGAAICILAAAMVLLVAVFVRRNLPAIYGDLRRLSLLSFIVLLSVLGLKVGATMLGLQFTGGQFGYLAMMSVAAAGMLVSVLLDTHLAVIVVALLSVLSGLIMNHEIRFTVMTLMSSFVGIGSCRTVRTRMNLLNTSLILSCTNLSLVWLMGLLLRDSISELATGSYWAVLMGFGATSVFWFGVLAFEKPFGILTHQTLTEMSSSDRPLLQQLCAVAPGTYAHSIMVGTLAEAGAQAIGADALLCRVGGYYHDIGKMKRPEFFVENQRNGNVHGRLSPSLSAIFITSHVRDGLELAAEKKLPQEIRDIIASHHGTTLIGYFYHQALMDCGGSDEAPPGLEERFRYPGPKPRTREAAVVMLADSVEAATRCLDRPKKDRLEAEIARIVCAKIEDGQFDDCPITFKDIKGIADAFVHVLEAMMHGRIAYPKLTTSADTLSGSISEVPSLGVKTPMVAALPASGSTLDRLAGSGSSRPEAAVSAFRNPLHVAHGTIVGNVNTEFEMEIAANDVAAAIVQSGETNRLLDAEEFHGSIGNERTDDCGKDQNASTGGQSIASVRASIRRGGQRAADG